MAILGFKVVYFRVIGKPVIDYLLTYNNFGLISKGSKDIATESMDSDQSRALLQSGRQRY